MNDKQLVSFFKKEFESIIADIRMIKKHNIEVYVANWLNLILNKRKKTTPLSSADHPARKCAIDIIECVIEPLIKKELNGEKYYVIEDEITRIIADKLK